MEAKGLNLVIIDKLPKGNQIKDMINNCQVILTEAKPDSDKKFELIVEEHSKIHNDKIQEMLIQYQS